MHLNLTNNGPKESQFQIYFMTKLRRGLTLSFAVIGTFLSILCIIFLVKYKTHRLIKATNFVTAIVLVVGTLIGYIPLFIYSLATPNTIVCIMTFQLHGASVAIIYSALIVKAITLVRLYFGSQKGNKTMRFVDQKSIAFQIFAALIVQVTYPTCICSIIPICRQRII